MAIVRCFSFWTKLHKELDHCAGSSWWNKFGKKNQTAHSFGSNVVHKERRSRIVQNALHIMLRMYAKRKFIAEQNTEMNARELACLWISLMQYPQLDVALLEVHVTSCYDWMTLLLGCKESMHSRGRGLNDRIKELIFFPLSLQQLQSK